MTRWDVVLFPCILLTLSAAVDGEPADLDTRRVPVVIAFAEQGINPYHVAFRAPTWTAHPSTYIPGYPSDALPFRITLDAPTFEEAWDRDEELWASVVPHQMYYIPGTRIVAAIVVSSPSGAMTQETFYDSDGTSHTTRTVDAAAGNYIGIAPDAAIVIVAGGAIPWDEFWVAEQPWIDILSTSTGCLLVGIPPGIHIPQEVQGWEAWIPSQAEATYRIALQGRLSFNGAGNDPLANPSTKCEYSGPSWVMSIGAVGGNGTEQYPYGFNSWYGRPFEVATFSEGAYAIRNTLTGTHYGGGTSMSGPRMAGYAARLIADARESLNDDGGFHDGAFAHAGPGAVLPSSGPLADGQLNRTELEDLLRRPANEYPTDIEFQWAGDNYPWLPEGGVPPPEIPPEAKYLFKGYGGYDEASYQEATSILFGDAPMPDRPYEDQWHARFDALADLYWEPLACRGEHYDEDWSGCFTEGVPRHAQSLLNSI